MHEGVTFLTNVVAAYQLAATPLALQLADHAAHKLDLPGWQQARVVIEPPFATLNATVIGGGWQVTLRNGRIKDVEETSLAAKRRLTSNGHSAQFEQIRHIVNDRPYPTNAMVDLAIQRLRGTDWDVSGILKTGQPQVGRMVDGIPGNVLDVVHWTLREQGKEFEEDVATVIHHWSTGELHILSLRDGRLDTNPPVRVPNLATILGPRPTAPDLLAAEYGGHRNLKSLRNSRKVEVRLVRDDSENERKIQVTPWRTLNPEQRARMVQFLVNPDHFELFPEGSRFCAFRANARIRMQTDQGTMVFEACFGCDELRLHRPGKLENILRFEAGQHVLYALLAEVFPLHPELGPAPDPAGIPDQETNRQRTEAALDRFWGRWKVSR